MVKITENSRQLYELIKVKSQELRVKSQESKVKSQKRCDPAEFLIRQGRLTKTRALLSVKSQELI